MFFSKSKNVVGLDIGSSAIKLVELKEKKGGTYSLVKLGLERLSPEAIVDGSIMDSSMVVETISRLNSEQGVKNSNYATSLSGHSVIIKKITPAGDVARRSWPSRSSGKPSSTSPSTSTTSTSTTSR